MLVCLRLNSLSSLKFLDYILKLMLERNDEETCWYYLELEYVDGFKGCLLLQSQEFSCSIPEHHLSFRMVLHK